MARDAPDPLPTDVTVAGPIAVALRDCLEGLAQLSAGCVDVVVTSPPYNLGVVYGTYDDAGLCADYLARMGGWRGGGVSGTRWG